MPIPIQSKDLAKAAAAIVRAEAAAAGRKVSRSAALERVAIGHGFTNWNALSARLAKTADRPLQAGERVEGRYLKQPFTGVVVSAREAGTADALEVSIALDEAVDVVTFEAFSNFRRRIAATVSPGGVSFAKTGDGVPQLIAARATARSE